MERLKREARPRQHNPLRQMGTLGQSCIEALIGQGTVITISLETLEAYRDHGEPQIRIEQETAQARWILDRLPELGIDFNTMTQQLEDEGVDKFSKSFDQLIETLAKAARQ